MKSTYKILSINLDGGELAKDLEIKKWTSKDENLNSLSEELNLFDYPYCKRVILGSTLLANEIEGTSSQIYQLNDTIKELIVKIDFISTLIVVNKLYIKRIFQALYQLEQIYPNLVISISLDECDLEKFKEIHDSIENTEEQFHFCNGHFQKLTY